MPAAAGDEVTGTFHVSVLACAGPRDYEVGVIVQQSAISRVKSFHIALHEGLWVPGGQYGEPLQHEVVHAVIILRESSIPLLGAHNGILPLLPPIRDRQAVV